MPDISLILRSETPSIMSSHTRAPSSGLQSRYLRDTPKDPLALGVVVDAAPYTRASCGAGRQRTPDLPQPVSEISPWDPSAAVPARARAG
jgi:hypothetical protein